MIEHGYERGYEAGRAESRELVENMSRQNTRLARERDSAMKALVQVWEAAARILDEGVAGSSQSGSETQVRPAAQAPSAEAGSGQAGSETQATSAAPAPLKPDPLTEKYLEVKRLLAAVMDRHGHRPSCPSARLGSGFVCECGWSAIERGVRAVMEGAKGGQTEREAQAGSAAPAPFDDLLHAAWGLIANAGAGDWERETPTWRAAASRWRDRYHEWLKEHPLCEVCGAVGYGNATCPECHSHWPSHRGCSICGTGGPQC